jgi:DNA invertase Pin-like site-specific DNA recombinase
VLPDIAAVNIAPHPQHRAVNFDLVLFRSLDRLSREGVLQTLTHLQTLTSYGVGWKSYTEQCLDSCGMFRDTVLSILATIANQERVSLSERTIAGLERARKQGWTGGRQVARIVAGA